MSDPPATLRPIATLGFIGLGVMGEPMCGHLARRSGRPVLAHDLRPEPLTRLAADGVRPAQLAEIAEKCDLILLSLPDGKAVAAVVAALEPHLSPGQCVVDTSTSSVALTREIGARLTARGIGYADAPVARTREAAARGELSIMVGATDAVFAHMRPVLETMGTDVTHCGGIGCGQVVKILNNMLVFQHTAALAEAMAIGRRNGVPPEMLLPTIAKGSGDSFVLRSHGMKSMLPARFPGARLLHALRDQGPVLRAGDGRRRRSRGSRGRTDHAASAPVRTGRQRRGLPPRRAAVDRPGMSAWPNAAAWCDACADDAVLAAWRGPWSVAFAVADDGTTTSPSSTADCRVAESLSSPSPHRPRSGRNSSPRCRRGTITRCSPCWPGCQSSPIRGDQLAFLQHCHVVRRVLEIGKWLALGRTAPVPASLHPPLGTPTPAPRVTGGYVPVTAGGDTYQIYYEHTGNGPRSAVPAHRRCRRAAVPPPDGRSSG